MASDSHNSLPVSDDSREASSDDFKPLTPREQALVTGWTSEVARLREALREITNWAEAARGHYGIEECSGPGQARTEWDEVQDGLRAAALFAREALEAGER